jgi:predicted P-loop ATPase/GTPase
LSCEARRWWSISQQKRSVVNVRRYDRVVSFFESATDPWSQQKRSVVDVRRFDSVVSFFESATDPWNQKLKPAEEECC